LHARRIARRQGWWHGVTSAIQGLRSLYQYQGRLSEWSRLVTEITPDFCNTEDAPISGREDSYSIVMGYRVDLARQHARDFVRAAALQKKCIAWDRKQAAPALALPPGSPLDGDQRNSIRSLSVAVFTLGQILRDQGNPDCVAVYEEAIRYDQRIEDTAGEATDHYDLGHAYKDIAAIRNLDAAEAAYQRGLNLWDSRNVLGRSRSIKQIGMVYHARFRESRKRGEPAETILKHAQAAEQHYHEALALCPSTALTDLSPIRSVLGSLYNDIGDTERARGHYEKDVQICEQTGDRYGAGQTRHNIAVMYLQVASRETTPSRQRDILHYAQAYAQAAMGDFQSYQGRAADMEAKVQGLLDEIGQTLTTLQK
jgi:tetratricopeptide (TPR) repeat protein